MSPSGLARLAGLDPTTFNKSKRGAANGKLRWPSTESLAKVLSATGASLDDFVALVSDTAHRTFKARMVPLIGWPRRAMPAFSTIAGFPAGSGWEDIAFPEIGDPHCYALEDHRRFHAAGLSRRRPHHGVATGQPAAGRPGGGQDPCRRSDGQAAWPADGQRIELRSFIRLSKTATFP